MHEEVNDLHRRGDRQNHGRSVMGIERKGRKEEGFHFFLPFLSIPQIFGTAMGTAARTEDDRRGATEVVDGFFAAMDSHWTCLFDA